MCVFTLQIMPQNCKFCFVLLFGLCIISRQNGPDRVKNTAFSFKVRKPTFFLKSLKNIAYFFFKGSLTPDNYPFTHDILQKFTAVFADDTRPATAKTAQNSQAYAAQCVRHAFCFCADSPRAARVLCAKIAQCCGRKPRDFCVEIFESQRDCSRKRTKNP